MCRSLVLWSRAQAASLTLESSSTLICFWAPVEGQATLTCGIAERERERDKARSLAQELRQSKPDDWGDGRRAGRRPSRAVTVPHRSSTPAILLVVVDDPHLHVVVRSSVWVGCARRVALLLWLLDPLDLWAPPSFLFFLFLSLVCRNQVLRDSAGRPGGRGGGGSYLSPKMGKQPIFLDFSIKNENVFRQRFQRSKINTLWTTSLAAGRSSGLSDSISMTRPAS